MMDVMKITTMKTLEIKRVALATVCLAALSVVGASPATAEESPAEMNTVEPNTVGLGAGATFGGFSAEFSSLPISIAVPIRLDDNWRLEPRLQASYVDAESLRNLQQADGEVTSTRSERTSLSLKVSVDVHNLWQVADATLAYAGGRVGTSRTWSDSDGQGGLGGLAGQGGLPDQRTYLLGGPVLGGEYLVSQNFSTGVEAAVLYSYQSRSYDAPEGSNIADSEDTRHEVNTSASIFMRIYLW